MNKNLQQLFGISRKPVRHIIGLMSGTSLDGLDVALCAISNHGVNTELKLLHFETVAYPLHVKQEIRKVFAKEMIDFQQLCLLNPWIGNLHAAYVLQCLNRWNLYPEDIDIIASHGQTVYHSPKAFHQNESFPNATMQIGDGDHIAVKTGIITISDFRQKHLAAGGEGAPLALYGDYLLFSKKGEPRIMLNMGGIANFTFLPGSSGPAAILVTDTGPGNTLIDAYARQYFQIEFDVDALLASRGEVNTALLQILKADSFFTKGLPKTTGPELFNLKYLEHAQVVSNTETISPYDMMATLTRFSADTIAEAIQKLPVEISNLTIYASGGGAHNPLLIKLITEALKGVKLYTTEKLGIPGDAKEAILFAVLANEAICGEPLTFNKPDMPAIHMGKVSFPF